MTERVHVFLLEGFLPLALSPYHFYFNGSSCYDSNAIVFILIVQVVVSMLIMLIVMKRMYIYLTILAWHQATMNTL